MHHRNIKTKNLYLVIRNAINCNNTLDSDDDQAIIYTRYEGRFIKLRLFIIRLLLPDSVFIRIESEFNEKFEEVNE